MAWEPLDNNAYQTHTSLNLATTEFCRLNWWWNRLWNSGDVRASHHRLVAACRAVSAWIDQGRITDGCRSRLLKDLQHAESLLEKKQRRLLGFNFRR